MDASLIFDIDSSRARTAATDLAKLGQAAVKLERDATKANTALRDSGGRFISSADSAKKYGAEVASLASKFNPALSAVYKFQAAQVELNRAVQLGVISQSQYDAKLSQVQAEITRTTAATQGLASSQRVAGAQTANVFSQLNDIGVMLAAGQNPFQLALQQGTQLNQVWTSMGASGRTLGGVAGVLRGAFASMLSPMSLLTIGVIAGTSALINWATSTDDSVSSAEALKAKMDELKVGVDALNTSLTLSVPENYDKVLEKYGTLNQQVRDHVANMDALNAQLISLSKISFTGLFSDTFGGYITTQIDEMRIAFGRTNDNARYLVGLLNEVEKAQGPQNQAKALDDLIRALIASAGGVDKLNSKQSDFILQLEAARSLALQGANALSKYAPTLDKATNAAKRLVDQLSSIPYVMGAPQYGGTSPFDLGLGSALAPRNSIRPQARPNDGGTGNFNDPKRERGGGGAGARELKAAEKAFQNIRELLEKETLFQFAEYEKRQKQLEAAYAKNLLTEKQYMTMKQQLQAVYFGTEFEKRKVEYDMSHSQLVEALEREYLTREQYEAKKKELEWGYVNQALDLNSTAFGAQLNGMATHFGQLNTLAGGGYDGLLRAQQSFAAASALISAYQGAAAALADPNISWFGRIAAYAKVLAAGMGAVNAIKGGGKSSGSGAGASASAAQPEPQKNILVRLEGPDYMVDMAEEIMTQIYEQSKDGRVIIARD